MTYLFSGCKNDEAVINSESEYLVIYSDMLKPDGGYYYINKNGEILNKNQKLNMQDLSCFDVKNDKIIISGKRKNNSLVIKRNSSEFTKDLFFLNDPSYTGLTAVTSKENNILGIMNGNFSDNTYLNLLVLQTLDGEILQQYPIEIFAHAVLYENNPIIAGAFITSEESLSFASEILECSSNGTKPHKYKQYSGFWDIVSDNNSYYCLTERKNENKNTITVIDKNDFSIENEIIFPDILTDIFPYNNSIYAIGNKGLYKLESKTDNYKLEIEFEKSLCNNDAYAYFSYNIDEKVYVFLRYTQRQKIENTYDYGNIIQIDLKNLDYQTTNIYNPKRDGLNNIFVVPSSFINNH